MGLLGERSMKNLWGVHPALVQVILRAAEGPIPFIVTEGLRTLERQRILLAEGKSRTMRSRHLAPLSHAVDLAVCLPGGGISWDKGDYRMLALQVKVAAAELDVPIEWGGEAFGANFYDGPHFQLPWKDFPAEVPNLNPPGQETKT